MSTVAAILLFLVFPLGLIFAWALLTAPTVPPDYDGDSEPFPKTDEDR